VERSSRKVGSGLIVLPSKAMWDETNKPVWLRWHDVTLLNMEKKYEEALRAGKELLERFPQERVEGVWAALAQSYQGLKRVQEAESALAEGARRYPGSAVYAFMTGDLFARTSAGNPQRRQAAILNWKNALQIQATAEMPVSTYDFLKEEIEALSTLSVEREYPPVHPRVVGVLEQMQACGLFEGRTPLEVATELAAIAPWIVRPSKDGSINIADLLHAESNRYLFVDWRFSAEEVLKEATSQAHEPAIQVTDVSDTYRWLGYRTVSFKLHGSDVRKTVGGATGLIYLLNSRLRKLGQKRMYWQAWKWTFESCCHFLLMSDEEMRKLRSLKLLPLSRL
jgi:tetratricopeptide (TPR) repeat protein